VKVAEDQLGLRPPVAWQVGRVDRLADHLRNQARGRVRVRDEIRVRAGVGVRVGVGVGVRVRRTRSRCDRGAGAPTWCAATAAESTPG